MLIPDLYLKDDFLFIYGNRPESMFFIVSGSVKMLNAFGLCEQVMRSGSFFGENDLLGGPLARCTSSAVASSATVELYRLSRENLQVVMTEFPKFKETLQLAARILKANAKANFRADTVGNSSETKKCGESAMDVSVIHSTPYGVTGWSEVRQKSKFSSMMTHMAERDKELRALMYDPQPWNLSNIEPMPSLQYLALIVAKQMHERWAANHLANDGSKSSPKLQSWESLTSDQQNAEVNTAILLLKMIVVLGYHIEANEEEEVDAELSGPAASNTHNPADGDPNAPHFRISKRAAEVKFSETKETYTPQPIETEDIQVPKELNFLIDAMCSNMHDIWARAKMEDGYTFGKASDEASKKSANLVDFCHLPKDQQEKNREIVRNCIKLLYALGHSLVPSKHKDHEVTVHHEEEKPLRQIVDDLTVGLHHANERLFRIETMLCEMAGKPKPVRGGLPTNSTEMKLEDFQ
eukprot:g1030.t1